MTKLSALTRSPASPDALPYHVSMRDPTQQYLVLGSAYLGCDPEILAVLRNYASFNKSQAIHLGPIATADEVKMYRFRQGKLRTFEKLKAANKLSTDLDEAEMESILEQAYEEVCGGTAATQLTWDDFTEEELTPVDVQALRFQLKIRIQAETAAAEMKVLDDAQSKRLDVLTTFFPDVKFAYSKMDILDGDNPPPCMLGAANLGTHFRPSKYVGMTSTMANGPKITHWPITNRILKALKHMKHSWIMPHPIVQAESLARPGLNNADNFFTTGRMSFADPITHTSEIHFAAHLPGAVALTLDSDGTFFARNIIVEQTDDGIPFTAEDDRLYLPTMSAALPSDQIVVGVTDTHTPHDHRGSKAVVHAAGIELKPGHIVDGGDATDFESVSPHAINNPGEQEGKRLGADLRSLDEHLSFLRSINPQAKLTLVDSNHHEWVTRFVSRNPALTDMLHWKVLAKRFEGWSVMIREPGDNVIHRIADMTFRHGDQESVDKAEEVFTKYVGGHWHRFRRIGHCLSVGALCKLGPRYLGGQITAWQNQFFTVATYMGKALNQAKTILHRGNSSKTVLRNKIIEITLLSRDVQ